MLVCPETGLKTCTKCMVGKPIDQFTVRRKSPDGLSLICRECSAALNRSRYQLRKDHIKAKAAVWAAANKERRRVIANAYDKRNIDAKRARGRKRNKEIYHADLEAARDKVRRENRRFRERNPERAREIVRNANARSKARDPVSFNLKKLEGRNRRRARQAAATVGVVDYQVIKVRDGMICHLCGGVVREDDLHFDHKIPLARGGPHSMSNIFVSHSWCNLSKGAKIL